MDNKNDCEVKFQYKNGKMFRRNNRKPDYLHYSHIKALSRFFFSICFLNLKGSFSCSYH
jgi:hypothetical protein